MISKRIQEMTPSATGGMKTIVNEMRRRGETVYSFTSGEPDFATPRNVSNAAIRAIEDGLTKYAAYPGVLALRQAVSKRLEADHGLTYGEKQICVTTGAKQAIANAILSLVNPGEEVILPSPCWVSYTEQVKLAGGVPVLVPTDEKNGFSLDIDAIECAVTPKTRLVLINNPNNPTGAVYSGKQLEALVALAEKHGLYMISDEVYEKLIYDDAPFVSLPTVSDYARSHTVLVNGCSKAYAMTGWRIGYACGPENVVEAIVTLLGHMTSGPNTIAQHAAIEALSGPQDEVAAMRTEFDGRRRAIWARLNAMPGIACPMPSGAFYVMPNVSAFFGATYDGVRIDDSFGFAKYLLKRGVAVVAGGAFFAPESVRLSYSVGMDVIEKGMDRMASALLELRR